MATVSLHNDPTDTASFRSSLARLGALLLRLADGLDSARDARRALRRNRYASLFA